MLRMLLTVIAAVLAVKVLLNMLRPKKQEPTVKGRPTKSSVTDRRLEDIEDADFKEIK
ncbi:MAG: hypothetical protein KDB65_02965 [Calditrichaeota bacterium]|nr:hypothetical protein [Calditrichota bacterium]MCB9367915.1 hypothetical protein [Calditrichota bacterium]